MNRFLKVFLVLALCVGLTFSQVGCSVSQFEAVLNEVAPAVLDVLQIVALFNGIPVNTSVTTKIAADVAGLEKLYADFTAAKDATTQAGIKVDIQAAFTTLNADLSSVFAVAQVTDPQTQLKIAALIGLIQTAVNIAEAVVTPAVGASLSPKLTASDLVISYDKVLTAKTGNVKVDNYTKAHAIHVHGSLLRHLSLGMAK